MTKRLRVGIVGLGRIFDLNCVGYANHPDADVVALCDVNDEAIAARQALFPNARGFTNFDDMLRHDLDLVDILSPHPVHKDMTIAALNAGAHVSVQKPMAMNLGECDTMIAAADKAGRRLKIFENFVFYPPLVKARELMRSGAIGKPQHFRMKAVIGDRSLAWAVPAGTNAWRQEINKAGLGGPIVFDHGHHMMAVALWLFGDARHGFARIDATPTSPGQSLDGPATLFWQHEEHGVHTIWDVSIALKMRVRTNYYASHERFEIQGDEGLIVVSRCSDRLLDEPVLTLYSGGEVRSWHNIDDDWGNSFRLSTLHFIDVLRDRAPQQILTGQEGRRVIALFEALHRSSKSMHLETVEASG